MQFISCIFQKVNDITGLYEDHCKTNQSVIQNKFNNMHTNKTF